MSIVERLGGSGAAKIQQLSHTAKFLRIFLHICQEDGDYFSIIPFPVCQRTRKPSAIANHACMNLQIAEAQPLFCKEHATSLYPLSLTGWKTSVPPSSTVGRGAGRNEWMCITELQEPAFFQQSFDFGIGNVATFGFVVNIEEIDFSLIHCCYDRNRDNPCASALASAF